MFGDNDQNQTTNDTTSTGPANLPSVPPADDHLSSFTMDPPHKNTPLTEPTLAATIEPPAPVPPLDPKLLDEPDNNTNAADEVAPPASTPASEPTQEEPNKPSSDNELLEIKKQALSQLSPLVSHLDQSPEEKFKTFMMMIQASDDQSLIKQAHEVAGQISDDKAKAEALLDIINEINYFTQQSDN